MRLCPYCAIIILNANHALRHILYSLLSAEGGDSKERCAVGELSAVNKNVMLQISEVGLTAIFRKVVRLIQILGDMYHEL